MYKILSDHKHILKYYVTKTLFDIFITNHQKNLTNKTQKIIGVFWRTALPITHHQSRCTLYLFGFSEKENPKRMPLHRGEIKLLGVSKTPKC